MKKIEAIIRKSQFDEVTEALHEVGIDFFTYWDVTGVGNEKSGAVYRAVVYETRLIERRTISFVCRDKFVDAATQAIVKAAKPVKWEMEKSSYQLSTSQFAYAQVKKDLNHYILKNNNIHLKKYTLWI